MDAGVVGAKIEKLEEPEANEETLIIGDTFIKPKTEYIYYVNTNRDGYWYLGKTKVPVKLDAFVDERNYSAVRIMWNPVFYLLIKI